MMWAIVVAGNCVHLWCSYSRAEQRCADEDAARRGGASVVGARLDYA